MSKNGVTRWRKVRAPVLRSDSSRTSPGKSGGTNTTIVDRQIAALLAERRDARLVDRLAGRIVALERRKSRRIDLARVAIADIDHLPGLRRGHAVEAERRQAVLLRVADERIDRAIVGDDRAGADFVGHHMRPWARRAMGQMKFVAVGREGKRPARRQRECRLDRAAYGGRAAPHRPRAIGGRSSRRAMRSAAARLIVGAAGDELDFRDAVRAKLDVQRQTGRRIERPQLAFVIGLAPSPGSQSGRAGERALADEAGARILIADQPNAGVSPRTAKNAISSRSGARRAQQAVAGENRVEPGNEKGFDMHAGEIEIARIGPGFMRRDFGETGQARARGAAGLVGEANAPGSRTAPCGSGPISIDAASPPISLPMTRPLRPVSATP